MNQNAKMNCFWNIISLETLGLDYRHPWFKKLNAGAVAAAASVVYDERCWLEDISWRMQIALRWRKWQKWIQVKDVQGLRIFMIKVSWSIIAAYQSHDNIFYRLIILRKGLRNFMIEVSGRLLQHIPKPWHYLLKG